MNWITVKSSHYQNDLVVFKGRLEAEGIRCQLKNELTAQVINYVPAFVVELQVPEVDLPRVKEIMIENEDWNNEAVKPICPVCGSAKIQMNISLIKRVKVFFAIALSALVFSNLPVDKLFKNEKFRCDGCGNEFLP